MYVYHYLLWEHINSESKQGFHFPTLPRKACPDVGFEFNELLGHRDLTSRGCDHKRSAGKMHKIYGKTQWYGKTKWPNDPMTQCHKSLLGMIHGVGFTMQNTTWRSIYTIYNELCGKSLNVKWLISSGSLSNRGLHATPSATMTSWANYQTSIQDIKTGMPIIEKITLALGLSNHTASYNNGLNQNRCIISLF